MIQSVKVLVLATDQPTRWKLRWRDPLSGKMKQRRVEAKNRKEATRQAGALEQRIGEGAVVQTRPLLWTEFKRRYFAEHVSRLAPSSRNNIATSFRHVDRVLRLRHVAELDAQRISYFQSKLREEGATAATVNGHTRNLRTALNWAAEMEFVAKCPRIRFDPEPKGAKMKGGHVSEADFLRALEVLPEVVPTEAVESWRFYLRGMWESGLRLKESLGLSWDDPERSHVDLSTPRGEKIVIRAECEKGRQNRIWPMPPRLALLLRTVPSERRTGLVFRIAGPRGGLTDDKTVSRTAGKIFERAGVQAVFGATSRRATLHDLRRTFILRMKRELQDRYDLQRISRHNDFSTTEDYYLGDDDAHLQARLWAAFDAGSLALRNWP